MTIRSRALTDRWELYERQEPQAPRGAITRLVSFFATLITCSVFTTGAMSSVLDPSSATLRGETTRLVAISLVGPAAFLCIGVVARSIDVSYCIYWAWSFVFLGMAPAYQIANQSFPWKGAISEESAAAALKLVIFCHLAFLTAYIYFRRRRTEQAELATRDRNEERLRHLFGQLSASYCAFAIIFIGLMGSSLYNARSQFRDQVLVISQLPFGGTLYFLVTAGAITIPSALIAARRAGAHVSLLMVAAPLVCAAIVTNPLLGSRFLTGSFLVSISIAAFYGRPILRLVPVASIVLLTVLFPTLDVLRGDSSSSTEVQALDPATSVQTYDFDAFEMLAREIGLSEVDSLAIPSSTHLALAPVLRWIPVAARPFIGDSGGAVVAQATGMEYTNVSMPLQGEGHLIAGPIGGVALLGALGAWLGMSSAANRSSVSSTVSDNADFATKVCAPATGALLFIVLRGSLYEVLAYLMLVLALYVTIRRKGHQ